MRRLVHAAVVDASIGELDCGGVDGRVVRPTVDVADLAEQDSVRLRQTAWSDVRLGDACRNWHVLWSGGGCGCHAVTPIG